MTHSEQASLFLHSGRIAFRYHLVLLSGGKQRIVFGAGRPSTDLSRRERLAADGRLCYSVFATVSAARSLASSGKKHRGRALDPGESPTVSLRLLFYSDCTTDTGETQNPLKAPQNPFCLGQASVTPSHWYTRTCAFQAALLQVSSWLAHNRSAFLPLTALMSLPGAFACRYLNLATTVKNAVGSISTTVGSEVPSDAASEPGKLESVIHDG